MDSMENNSKNYNFPYKYMIIHTILYPISYVLDILNFSIILAEKYRSFFISCYIVQGLVIIFMVKFLCLFKSKYDSTDNIRCIIIIYTFLSLISLIFVGIEYLLILKNFNLPKCKMDKKYKIPFICIGILYHAYHNLSFIYECIIILKAVKKNIDERIQNQAAENQNEKNKNETQSSEKQDKKESLVKEDTIYIIHGNFNDKLNNEFSNIQRININNINNDINSCSRSEINLNLKKINTKEFQKNKLNNEINIKIKNLPPQLSHEDNKEQKISILDLKPQLTQKNK